jgi:hypothetical protein
VAVTYDQAADQLTFHRFLPYFLIECAAWLAGGTIFLALLLGTRQIGWLAGCIGLGGIAVMRARTFHMGTIIIHGPILIIRQGFLIVREVHTPIYQVHLHIDQHVLGQLCDYATVTQSIGSVQIRIRAVAAAQLLVRVVRERRQALNALLHDDRPGWHSVK